MNGSLSTQKTQDVLDTSLGRLCMLWTSLKHLRNFFCLLGIRYVIPYSPDVYPAYVATMKNPAFRLWTFGLFGVKKHKQNIQLYTFNENGQQLFTWSLIRWNILENWNCTASDLFVVWVFVLEAWPKHSQPFTLQKEQ